MAIWGDLTNIWGKKKSQREKRKENIYPTECRLLKNSKEKQRGLSQWIKCKEIEGNNRMENTKGSFKKIGDTKGIFHTYMGILKDRQGKDLNEAEEMKKRWQEYREELCEKGLNDLDNHNGGSLTRARYPGVWSKVSLGSILTDKASGGNVILVELFQILKNESESAALIMPANLENSGVATGQENVSFHFNPKEGQCQRMFKLSYNCAHFTC